MTQRDLSLVHDKKIKMKFSLNLDSIKGVEQHPNEQLKNKDNNLESMLDLYQI